MDRHTPREVAGAENRLEETRRKAKNLNHGGTADTAENKNGLSAFAFRRVRRAAVVNCFSLFAVPPWLSGVS
ncbi:hypothetical protein AGMMS50256_29680 [Betaproteobacteria bacterium]|nr:hypothetical protein AGMMS50256_29680 [Betaproteobacteria bacterium]